MLLIQNWSIPETYYVILFYRMGCLHFIFAFGFKSKVDLSIVSFVTDDNGQ
jgi:hypothetical protein